TLRYPGGGRHRRVCAGRVLLENSGDGGGGSGNAYAFHVRTDHSMLFRRRVPGHRALLPAEQNAAGDSSATGAWRSVATHEQLALVEHEESCQKGGRWPLSARPTLFVALGLPET